MKILKTFPRGERCVGIVIHKESVYVATDRRIFVVVNDRLVPLKFEQAAEALKK